MITISLCMIVKNESHTIARCLDSVKHLVDEIIIVDTGSSDDTKDIVRRYTQQIFDFVWIDDFAAARNFSFQQASMDYILWLDADDVITEENQKKLRHLKNTLSNLVDAVSMHYYLAFDSEGHVTSSLRRNRLVKRLNSFQWHGFVHEYLAVGGRIYTSDIAITHYPIEHDNDRNLRIYEQRLAMGETFTPRDMLYYANECLDHQFLPRAVEYYQKFMDTKQGWVEDNITACGKLADCYYQQGDADHERQYTLKSFEYDIPRAEFCCRLGYGFITRGEWNSAIFWYKLATTLPTPKETWGMVNRACSTWIPHVQLCVCYDQIGEYQLAYEHNEIARQYRPHDEQILQNKHYLESILCP